MTDPRSSTASSADDDGFAPTVLLQASVPPASHDALLAGMLVGEYEILGVLGEGGFGIVYLAHDPVLDRPVAIKEYLPVALASRSSNGTGVTLRAAAHADTFAAGMKSFINEGRMLARFDHPALVRVHRFWQENNTAYMAMPYYEGSTLQAVRRAMQQPPDEAWLRALIEPLLGALEVLHAENCYHRDISPDNILLLKESGRPVLLDFGAARRVIEDRTQLLTAILKPAFAPIEQYAEGSRVHQGPWTDLYALAAVIRYCVTGNAPLPATVRAVDDQMQPMGDIAMTIATAFPNVRYSEPFLRAMDWALAVLPQERPRSVAQWREALAGGPAGARSRPSVALYTLPGRTAAESQPAATGMAAATATGPAPEGEPVDPAVRAALDAALAGFDTLPHLRPQPAGASANAGVGADAPGADLEPAPPSPEALAAMEAGAMSYDQPPPRRHRVLRWAGVAALVGAVAVSAGPLKRYVDAERQAALISQAALRASQDDKQAAPRGEQPAADVTPARTTPQPMSSDVDVARLETEPPAAGPSPPTAVHPAPTPTPAHPAVPAATHPPAPTMQAAAATPPPPAVPAAVPAVPAQPPVQVAKADASKAPNASHNSRTPDAAAGRPPARANAGASAREAAPAQPERDPAATRMKTTLTPRMACGTREQFALYRCMQQQCQRKQFAQHAQCKSLREHDEVLQ